MARFHLPAEQWQSPTPALEGAEARHLSQVLRIRRGEMIGVFDGCGRRAQAQVLNASRDHVALQLGEASHRPAARPAITLGQAIPKGKNMEWIVQKAVELGVAAIQPLVTRHTVVQPGDGKSDKWRRIALEACKQCGQDTLPRIADPLAFPCWLAEGNMPGLRVIASLAPGARPMREVLREHASVTGVTLLIGPEGDFGALETTAALEAGFLPVSLGDIVLRVETATLFGLSALRYEYA